VKTYKTGFVPGEHLSVEARVKNPTSVVILHLKYSLVKRVLYQSETPHINTLQEDTVVYEISKGTPMSNCRRDYIIKFKVPDLPASTISQSFSAVKVKYFLNVTAVASGWNSSPTIDIPITIGTIPIIWTNRSTGQQDDTPLCLPSAPSINQVVEPSAPPIPLYPDR
jgi:hypothetical protein